MSNLFSEPGPCGPELTSTTECQSLSPPSPILDQLKPGLSYEHYKEIYRYSIEHSEAFWSYLARTYLHWQHPFSIAKLGDFSEGATSWFVDGHINACYNALDRHAVLTPDKIAIIYEADEPRTGRKITYAQLLAEVCQLTNWLSSLSYLKPGDVVTIYMPMIPEAAIAMLACARLGLVHNVVFAGFSAESLAGRIDDSHSRLVITSDQGVRGGKVYHLKETVDKAIQSLASVENVLVYKRTGASVYWKPGRDVYWQDVIPLERPYAPINLDLQSESPLFLLYTSGSTGKPKGILHTIAGYLLYAMMTSRFVFDFREGDVFGCMADIGWITGHSYVLYGPLCNGLTTVLFESIPTYPNASRYWQVVDDHKITQLYTAPTVIRALKSKGLAPLEGFDLSSLRVLGSVGEPIHPETWNWYSEAVGRNRCTVVDTFWQTETGGIVITPLPGGMPIKPGSASFPFFGIEPAILDPERGTLIEGNDVSGVLVLKTAWPGMARSIYKDHQKYVNTYFNPYKGYFFTGDGAIRDAQGYYFLTGRVDDVINVSGHRLSTCEIESALGKHPSTAEAAVLGEHDDLTGQAICAFVALRPGLYESSDRVKLSQELIAVVRATIGPIATPKRMVVCRDLPKTRSGKIMRRILRKLVSEKDKTKEELMVVLGDLTTLSDPSVIDHLLEIIRIDER